jgi:thioredoxin reductase
VTQSNFDSENIAEVAIVGAGPYGLSVAAHLAGRKIPFRIFGNPMYAWSGQMPQGMYLKSEGFASSLSDPRSELTLAEFCREQGLPYQDTGFPIPLETFVAYGIAFQKRFAPNLENNLVKSVRRVRNGFELQLEDGERALARKVVLAVGISMFAHIPDALSGISEEYVSHSSAHSDLRRFKGRRVAVLGAGASAIDLAALLHKAGASVEIIARGPAIRFFDPPEPRSLRERITSPLTGLGTGFDFMFYEKAPHYFRLLPEKLRLNRVARTLGPRPGWFVRDQVVGKVPMHLSTSLAGASVENGSIRLQVNDGKGTRSLEYDHVIAGTGYRVDLERLSILSDELRRQIHLTGKSPSLSSHFESSAPGLYFIGVAAANTFGPVMRFAVGADITARRLSKHLAGKVRKSPVTVSQSEARQIFE